MSSSVPPVGPGGPQKPNGGQPPRKSAKPQGVQGGSDPKAKPLTKTPPPKTQTKEERLAEAETKKLKTLTRELITTYRLSEEATYGLDNAISDHTYRMRIGEITIEEFKAGQSGPNKPEGNPEFLPQARKAFLDIAQALDKTSLKKNRGSKSGLQIVIKLIQDYGEPLTNLLEEPSIWEKCYHLIRHGKWLPTRFKTFT